MEQIGIDGDFGGADWRSLGSMVASKMTEWVGDGRPDDRARDGS